MKKLDKIGVVFNCILGVLYIPVSFFSWILLMASEMKIGATNPVYIGIVDVFCVVSFFVPLLSVVGIVLSVCLRKKYSVLSFVIQFVPLIVFVLNFLLLGVTDFISK